MSDEALGLLRLEIERAADPGELVNLVQNPSGDLGAWAWVTPVDGALLRSIQVSGAYRLAYTSPGAVASFFYTEPMPVGVGTYLAAAWVAPVVDGRYKVSFEWLDADGVLVSATTKSGYLAFGVTEQAYGSHLVPAGVTYARLRFDHYADVSGGIPAAGTTLQLHDVTVTAAATSGALGVSRTNLLTNPSAETGTAGWGTPNDAALGITTTHSYVGTHALSVTRSWEAGSLIASAPLVEGVVGGRDYALQARVKPKTKARAVTMEARWFDATGKTISIVKVDTLTETLGEWSSRLAKVVTAPSNATSLRMRLNFGTVAVNETHYIDAAMVEQAGAVGAWFDGDTTDAGGVTYSWTGTPHASTSTAVSASMGVLAPIQYLNILGPTHELTTSREALNVGTLTAIVVDVALDPAQVETIQRGRRIRLVTLDGDVLYAGKVDQADVTYPLLAKNAQKRAQITLTAVDSVTPLASTLRAEGVATIAELPYVLEGCGVPWSVNGSGDQVPTADPVAYNSNASALDQVAITRDSQLGYAWVDRNGVMQVWDRDLMDSTVAAVLDETVYNANLDVGYSTADCVNAVTLSYLRVIATTGVTEEVTYGPYRDEDSIRDHGLYPSTYTVQGIVEDEATLAAYAQQILDTNAVPEVRVNQMVIPIRSAADLPRALLDLYDLVQVSNARAGIDELSRITRLEHSITPGKWLLTVGFSGEGAAAPSVSTPAPPPRVGDVRTEVLEQVDDAVDLANAAAAAADDAAANATIAMTSADGKTKITISTSGPGSTPNTAGVDVWWQKESSTQTIIGQWTGLGGTSWQQVTLNDSVIANLSAGKITAGSAFTNALSVKTNFTLGDASTNGVIQSYDFASSPVGVYIDKFGLVAKGGSITGADIIGGTFKTSDPSEHLEISHDAVYTGTQLRFLYDLDQVAKIVAWGTGAAPGIRISGEQQAILALDADSTNTDSIALDYNDTSHIINLRSTKGILLSAGTGTVDVSGPIVATGDITATGAGDVHGQFCFSDNAAGGGLTGASINNDGRIQRTAPSTRRVKENIEAHQVDVDAFLGAATVSQFTYTEAVPDVDHNEIQVGLIAEDLDDAGFDQWVTRDGAGEVSGIRYDRLTVPLLAVAQRQQQQIDDLTAQLAALADRVAALEGA